MGNDPESDRTHVKVEQLAAYHNRAAFSCGTPELDDYIRRYARQNARRDLSQCFVLVSQAGDPDVMGYSTLSGYTVETTALPPPLAQRLPPNLLLPATLLGRMAVDMRYQGQGYGEKLVLHALRVALRAAHRVASIGVAVDALNDEVVTFYTKPKLGFVVLLDRPRHLLIPMSRVRAMFPTEATGLEAVSDLIEDASKMTEGS